MNLLEALDARGIEYKNHSSLDNEILLCCPFCVERGETPDTRFRLGVNYVEGKAHCFNCSKRLRGEYMLIALKEKLDTGEFALAQEAVKRKDEQRKKIKPKLPEDFQLLTGEGKTHWGRKAREFVQKRGIADWQVKEKKIGYSMVGDLRYRIIIPVYYKGKLEGLVGRVFVVDIEPKYKNSLGEKVLYNVPNKTRKIAIISEGAFDALAIERYTKNNFGRKADSLACLGHDLTERQLEILEAYDEYILWPDPDKAGVKGFCRMGNVLQALKKPVWMVAPRLSGTEYDPSDLKLTEIEKKLKGVVLFTEELAQKLRAKLVFQED